jgi:hypothetical protein
MLQEIEKIREFHFVKKCKLGNEGCPFEEENLKKIYKNSHSVFVLII